MSMGPKQVQKGTVLGLSTDFTDPFPSRHPHPQPETAPLGCPHAPRDSWHLPDYRLIGGWKQLLGGGGYARLINPLVTRPSPKRPSPCHFRRQTQGP